MAAHLGVADADAAVDYLKTNVLSRCSSGWNDSVLREYLKKDVYQKFYDRAPAGSARFSEAWG